jgi:hypothetical protein
LPFGFADRTCIPVRTQSVRPFASMDERLTMLDADPAILVAGDRRHERRRLVNFPP